jgi:serine/threonine protein kinase/Tol biopolymer transport system component
MSLTPGTRIGTYEIEASLGAGGMGAVYRALDTKLGRRVAIKILPAGFADNPERKARFEREAQVLAALNHPHIAQIYGVDEGPALVMELVDGSTLADRIAQGPLPVDEALSIARQVAAALQAAHDKGIVHRDLKPSNIALTSEGNVKVLDFGLAKLTEASGPRAQASGDLTASPTLTSPAMVTGAGMILGTAAYMSPEQAKGRAADKRSDVWAFGCVLYEMLTGRRAFGGSDVSDTLASVLARDPDLAALPAAAPPSVRTLLERCFAKDARKRFADMSVVEYLLEEGQGVPSARRDISALSRRERYAWSAVVVIITAALLQLALLHFRETPPALPPGVRFAVSPPPGMTLATGVVTGGGIVSPDGRQIVFPTAPRAGATRLALRRLDADEARELSGTDGAIGAFWSPDSRFIGFLAGGKIQKIDTSGSPPQVVCDASGFVGGAWNRDGVILFALDNGPLMRVSASGGTPAPMTALDKSKNETSHRHPWFLPDGNHFLYTATSMTAESAIYVGSLDGGDRTLVTTTDTQAAYADGYLLLVRDNALLAQRFDPARLEMSGDPVVVARDISNSPSSAIGDFSVSTTGVLAFRRGTIGVPTELGWVDRNGKRLETVGEPADQTALRLSPDGRRVAISVFDSSKRSRDIWIHDFARGVRTRFTFNPGEHWSSIWSPDGRFLVFSANQGGLLDLYRKAADGAGAEELLTKSVGNNRYTGSWSADGRFILYGTGRTRSQTGNDVWLLPLSDNQEPRPFLQTRFNETEGMFSPDGRWVAYQSDESGRDEIAVVPFPGPGGKWQISTAGGQQPRWGPDGREIFFLEGNQKLMAAAVDGSGAALQLGQVRMLFEARFRTENYLGYGEGSVYDVSPDGRRFLINVVGSGERAQTPITVVTNWTSLIR